MPPAKLGHGTNWLAKVKPLRREAWYTSAGSAEFGLGTTTIAGVAVSMTASAGCAGTPTANGIASRGAVVTGDDAATVVNSTDTVPRGLVVATPHAQSDSFAVIVNGLIVTILPASIGVPRTREETSADTIGVQGAPAQALQQLHSWMYSPAVSITKELEFCKHQVEEGGVMRSHRIPRTAPALRHKDAGQPR